MLIGLRENLTCIDLGSLDQRSRSKGSIYKVWYLIFFRTFFISELSYFTCWFVLIETCPLLTMRSKVSVRMINVVKMVSLRYLESSVITELSYIICLANCFCEGLTLIHFVFFMSKVKVTWVKNSHGFCLLSWNLFITKLSYFTCWFVLVNTCPLLIIYIYIYIPYLITRSHHVNHPTTIISTFF